MGPKSKKIRKHSESKGHLDFHVILPLICDENLIEFDAKMEAALDGSLVEIEPYAEAK